MKIGSSPQKQPVRMDEPNPEQIHSGEGSDSAWQALQQVTRTKPRHGFMPTRSVHQEPFTAAKKGR